MEQGNHALVSDNGDTLLHLQSVGLDPFNRRRESLIRNIPTPFGVALEASGEIRAIGSCSAHRSYLHLRAVGARQSRARLARCSRTGEQLRG